MRGPVETILEVGKAKELPKEGFKDEVERYLTRRQTKPWEILYSKVYMSQLPVVEKALEATFEAREREVLRLSFGDDLCGLSGGAC